jgi:hypothetical protein
MKLGIYLNSQHPETEDPARRMAETLEQARLVAGLGFDSVWAGEHHVTPGFHYFPQLPLLQQVAAIAEGVWIGTNLILLPLHNPIELAEISAFMDVVTGGRFMFGVGLGYRPEEFAAFGIPMSERVSRLSEGIDIVRRLWSEDRVTHLGRHWQFHDVSIRPRPLQSPRPPILIGAQVTAAIARAARIADGWLAVPIPRLDQIAEQVSLFASTRAYVAAKRLDPGENIGLTHPGPAHPHACMSDPHAMLGHQHVRHLRWCANGETFGGEPAQLLLQVSVAIEGNILKPPRRIGRIFFEQIGRDAAECLIFIRSTADLDEAADMAARR